jgi:hypothetical protein
MGIYEGRGQLSKAMKELMQRWAETKNYWKDGVAAQFEVERLQTLEHDVKTAMTAMDHVGVLLQQARRDSSE